jgi:predicted kinase
MSEGSAFFIFSGLPGSGKTTLAKALARRIGGAYIRIDTIEQALRDLCAVNVEAEGYRLAYRVASDNLRAGLSVVADSCNPIELTRREWVTRCRGRAASASFHYALAPRWLGQRAAAKLRRYAATHFGVKLPVSMAAPVR